MDSSLDEDFESVNINKQNCMRHFFIIFPTISVNKGTQGLILSFFFVIFYLKDVKYDNRNYNDYHPG